jgi:hypothetical protein
MGLKMKDSGVNVVGRSRIRRLIFTLDIEDHIRETPACF